MRKFIAFFLVLMTLSFMVGCQKGGEEVLPDDNNVQDVEASQDTTDTKDESVSDGAVIDEEPSASADENPETEKEETEEKEEQQTEQETEEVGFKSYTQKIARHDQPVFAGPSVDDDYAGTVEEAGVYTIIEEATDDEGNLWGKLKSGYGWVNLTEIREFSDPISANFASEKLLDSGKYEHVTKENQDYVFQIAFYAYEKLSYITILGTELTDDGFAVGEEVYYIEELTPDKPLVADLSFPGDMSMYIVEFADESGAECSYRVYISGRNGMLILDDEIFD